MALNKYKLGDLLIQHDIRNTNNSLSNVKGISVRKEFREPTSKVNKKELSNYKLVYPNQFGSVQTTHNERCFAFAYNDTDNIVLISPVNLVFSVKDENVLLSRWLQLYFCRQEFDRYARFHSWGSARETFSWDDICNVEIELPSIEVQKKYVNIYNAMLENQKCYERGLEDLKLVCDVYIENLKNCKNDKIGHYIEKNKKKNRDKQYNKLSAKGINNIGQFIKPMRLFSGDVSSFKIIQKNDFVYNSRINSTIERLSIALNENDDLIVSPAYESFCVAKNSELYPFYLYMLLQRDCFAKKVLYNSYGSSTVVFGFDNLGEIEIPIPDMKKQKAVASIYRAYKERTSINEKLKSQIKNICPILIKGSIEEATTKEV